jgi:hypothetical protein
MRNRLLLPFLLGLILLTLVAAPVQAESAEELARQASLDFLGTDLTDPKPAYQKTAQDYVRMGNYYRDGCQKLNTRFKERIFSWAKTRAEVLESVSAVMIYKNPSHDLQLATLDDPQFQKDNPGAFAQYTQMMAWCNAARDNYNMAASMTGKNDYQQQAEIYDGAAVVYDTAGNTSAAEDARDEAAFARGRQRLASGSDCLIVTATFGSPIATEVQLVRDFRDDTIRKSYMGSRYVTALNAIYYSFSPAVARTIDENPSVKPAMRVVLAPLIGIVLVSQGVYSLLSFSPGIATVIFIISGGALVGLVYVLPVMLPALWVAMKRRWQIPVVSSLKPLAFLWAGLLAALVFSAFFAIDIIAILSSGLLFACTVFLTAGAVALYLSGYLGIRPAGRNE